MLEEAESLLIGWPPLPPTNSGPELVTEEISFIGVQRGFLPNILLIMLRNMFCVEQNINISCWTALDCQSVVGRGGKVWELSSG